MDEKRKENPLAIKSGDIFPDDAVEEMMKVKNHPLFKAANRTCLSQAETIRRLQSHIQSLESQLKVEWDDEMVGEIEERFNQALKDRWELCHWGITRIQGYDIQYLLSLLKKCQEELNKWTSPHEDSDLQWMKEQSNQSSLSAKQAYINALEWRVKHLEMEKKGLEDLQKEQEEIIYQEVRGEGELNGD